MGNELNEHSPTGHTIPDPSSVSEYGRTFHGFKEGKYLLPNDGAEQDRLDFAHEMWKLLLDGKLGLAPITQDPRHVLDIGTGTGIWVIDWAQQHPSSAVTGIDLSIIQPPVGVVPENCNFVRCDAEEGWGFDHHFDYIHLRAMCTCFSDGKAMVERIFANLNPGGWVEYQDFSMEMLGEDEAAEAAVQRSALKKWLGFSVKGAAAFGKDLQCALQYKRWMLEVGFKDVVERQVLAPMNPWPQNPKERRIGAFMEINTLEALEGTSIKILQGLGMSVDQIQDFVLEVKESTKDRSVRAYSPMYVVWGRKPLEE